jgi:hypothetical protein
MRRKRKGLTPDAPLAPVPSEILDQFVGQGPISHEELDAAVRRFKNAIIERALGGELTHHLGSPWRPEARGHDPSSKRDGREDSPDGRRANGDRGAARSRRQLRAAPDRQTRAAVHRSGRSTRQPALRRPRPRSRPSRLARGA